MNYILVNADRSIFIPESCKKIAIEHDHNVKTLEFKCPRYFGGMDVGDPSNCVVYINCMLPDKTPSAYHAEVTTVVSRLIGTYSESDLWGSVPITFSSNTAYKFNDTILETDDKGQFSDGAAITSTRGNSAYWMAADGCFSWDNAPSEDGFITIYEGVGDHDVDEITFTWTITKNMTPYKGSVWFLVEIKSVDADGNESHAWHSDPNKQLYISEGLEVSEETVNLKPDIVEQCLLTIDNSSYGKYIRRVNKLSEERDSLQSRVSFLEGRIANFEDRVSDIETGEIYVLKDGYQEPIAEAMSEVEEKLQKESQAISESISSTSKSLKDKAVRRNNTMLGELNGIGDKTANLESLVNPEIEHAKFQVKVPGVSRYRDIAATMFKYGDGTFEIFGSIKFPNAEPTNPLAYTVFSTADIKTAFGLDIGTRAVYGSWWGTLLKMPDSDTKWWDYTNGCPCIIGSGGEIKFSRHGKWIWLTGWETTLVDIPTCDFATGFVNSMIDFVMVGRWRD